MDCNKDFRHVCFKDLQNYIERDKYFSDFSEEEIKLIKENLGITGGNSTGSGDYNPTVIMATYDNILSLALTGEIKLGYIYIINNFRSIYLDKEGNILGLDNVPSTEYYLILTPTSTSTFDRRVSLKSKDSTNSESLKWIVEYDISPVALPDGSKSRGTILYLKDTNNNYAYYDFKNIKFLLTSEELRDFPKTYDLDQYFYTFDIDGQDGSTFICKNNHLEKGASRNIFLESTLNVTLAADCHDNIFLKSCENSIFDYGTYNNVFKNLVLNCKGSIHGKTINSITLYDGPKEFISLNDKLLIQYFDGQTMSNQIFEL